MVDRTVYPQGDRPSQAVCQIFARAKVPEVVCLKFGAADLRTVEMISVLGENHEKVRLSFTRICGGDQALGNDDREREKTLLWACVVWTACSKLHEVSSIQRAKMESDPRVIPSLPQDDMADFRSRFVLSHPDVILLPCREPHKKFVERMHRDFTIDSIVPCYDVGEFRRRNEQIAQKSGLAPSADLLVRMVQVDDLRTTVVNEAEVFDRITAFFVALEYLNICAFNEAEGTLRYFRELQIFNREWPGMFVLLKADKLIRTEVYRLNTDERPKFPSFSEALRNVLDTKHYLWDRAKTEYEISKMRGSSLASEALPPSDRGVKRIADAEDVTHGSGTMTRSKRRRLRTEAKAKPKPVEKTPQIVQARPEKGKGKGKTKGMAVNPDLWAKIAEFNSGKCKFFNAGKCKFGDKCKDPHACCSCGGAHAFAGSACSK